MPPVQDADAVHSVDLDLDLGRRRPGPGRDRSPARLGRSRHRGDGDGRDAGGDRPVPGWSTKSYQFERIYRGYVVCVAAVMFMVASFLFFNLEPRVRPDLPPALVLSALALSGLRAAGAVAVVLAGAPGRLALAGLMLVAGLGPAHGMRSVD